MTHALKTLEFEKIREALVGYCQTELGVLHAQKLLPSFNRPEIDAQLNLLQEAYNCFTLEPPPSMSGMIDRRKEFNRSSKGGILGATESFQCAVCLSVLRQLKQYLETKSSSAPKLIDATKDFLDTSRIESEVFRCLDPDGEMRDDASETLQALRRRKNQMGSRILEKIQSYLSGKTRDLLSDPIYTIRDGRYVLPLKAENKGKLKGIIHDTSASGQTVFIEPEEVLKLGNELKEIESLERHEIQKILGSLSKLLGSVSEHAHNGIEQAGRIDFLFSKIRYGLSLNSVVPQVANGDPTVEIYSGKHPLLEQSKVVPLNFRLSSDQRVILITGPNTGGKTVAMKTVGLFLVMAQAGMMVPATEMRFAPFSQFWADIGDEQSLQQSLSTFSGHIKNISEAIRDLKQGALVILDELGAGTDPAEGAALAQAILRTLYLKGAYVVSSTHFGELKAFVYQNEGFQNAAMEFDAKTLAPTYRLLLGTPGASHGLKIAHRYGISSEVIELAEEALGTDQRDVALMLEKLELAQKQARQAQSEADRQATELRKLQEQAQKKLREAEEIRARANQRASESLESTLREIRLEAAEIFEELKKEGAPQKSIDRARTKLKDLQVVGQELADEIEKPEEAWIPSKQEFKKGDQVRVQGYSQIGTLLDEPGQNILTVQMGAIKMKFPKNKISLFNSKPATKTNKTHTPNITLQKTHEVKTELHLRALRAEEAAYELDRFLDEAQLAKIPWARIVHGKGEGVLRNIIQKTLRKHKGIVSFRDGEPAEGGQGVTIVYFE